MYSFPFPLLEARIEAVWTEDNYIFLRIQLPQRSTVPLNLLMVMSTRPGFQVYTVHYIPTASN